MGVAFRSHGCSSCFYLAVRGFVFVLLCWYVHRCQVFHFYHSLRIIRVVLVFFVVNFCFKSYFLQGLPLADWMYWSFMIDTFLQFFRSFCFKDMFSSSCYYLWQFLCNYEVATTCWSLDAIRKLALRWVKGVDFWISWWHSNLKPFNHKFRLKLVLQYRYICSCLTEFNLNCIPLNDDLESSRKPFKPERRLSTEPWTSLSRTLRWHGKGSVSAKRSMTGFQETVCECGTEKI